jgi:hypothetical protein
MKPCLVGSGEKGGRVVDVMNKTTQLMLSRARECV